MRTTLLPGILLFPCLAAAATDCRVIELPEHFEAVCTGEADPGAVSQPPVAGHAGDSGAPEIQRRQRPQIEARETAKSARARVIKEQLQKEMEMEFRTVK